MGLLGVLSKVPSVSILLLHVSMLSVGSAFYKFFSLFFLFFFLFFLFCDCRGYIFIVGEFRGPSGFSERAETELLGLRLLPDGDHVHGGLRRHRLRHVHREGIPSPLPTRRTCKYELAS